MTTSMGRFVGFATVAMAAVMAIAPVRADEKPLTLPVQKPGSVAVLLSGERVQKELDLTTKQKGQIQALRAGYRDAVREIVAGVAVDDVAAKAAAQKAIQATTSSYNQRTLAVLTPDQKSRLSQIERQLLGGQILLAAEVREQLGLTPKQKAEIARIHQKHLKRVSEVNGWFEDGEVGNYERILYLRQDRLAQAEAMQEVLTKQQRTAFDALAGEPFTP